MLIMAIFLKCPLYTYIEVKHKICYYGGFSKIPYINNKRGVFIYMEFKNSRKYQKLTKTDKYTWSKKEENVNTLSPN